MHKPHAIPKLRSAGLNRNVLENLPWPFLSQPTISIALTAGFSKPFFSASFLKSLGVLPVFA
jgi:hypothetical protein